MGFVSVAGGEAKGPLLEAEAIPGSGGDWAHIRADGVVEFNAHYLLRATDGTLIYMKNQGYGRALPENFAEGDKIAVDELKPHYFRVTPKFDCPIGPYDWLTRTILLGIGTRDRGVDQTMFEYFLVR